ncbi:Glu/Leu/Phe/Val dehydrogenase dimerization domain-containing protein [Steroidobacter sp.]|uniref:Glu/Leu/Phe/Val dehydrogenase dimerization domain-containing protein n=1 Tax=Steroidobacter sp. TaxID=1978227 RepID=UPI001A4C0BE3|nr:Glu/Leu/Phe/Val dehydrogenase dimerization domain-containing protein [Steroidobacter sp.]MBL8267783.1 Glu/Leu/Phe/Val dehydrogenase [Steroidobacter sp.]
MAISESSEFDQHEQVCWFADPASGLKAIVAIHSTKLGPAVGGTRFWPYPTERLAVDDALRLSRAMSYKCALAGAPFGGGKAVIVGDPGVLKTRPLLHAYGKYLNRIGTVFCTGEDVGFSVADCEIIREVSPYIAGTNSAGAGDPSIHTAQGVFHGLRAVLEARLDRDDFSGVHVAVQGLGNVGSRLCQLLAEAGARLTVADVRSERADQLARELGAQVVDAELIHAVDADIFAPCALGGIVNERTLPQIKAKAIAGAANNQLAAATLGAELQRRNILFAPDYVINAGGVIGAVEEASRVPGRAQQSLEPVEVRLLRIHERLRDIFNRAELERTTPEAMATRIAQELIARAGR